MLKVLYEDNHVIVVDKPAGFLVQPDGSDAPCIMDTIKEYIKETYHKPGNVFLGLVHRLDRNVSGVVLFAKTSKGASRLSEQFRLHSIKKTYQALVEGNIKGEIESKITLKNYMKKDEKILKSIVFDTEQSGSQYAELSFTKLISDDNKSLVQIDLETGRFHQIRSQLAHIGHPIIGDVKYGSRIKMEDHEILLRACKLEFDTATDTKRVVVETEPIDFNAVAFE